jgi:hypothetical protein
MGAILFDGITKYPLMLCFAFLPFAFVFSFELTNFSVFYPNFFTAFLVIALCIFLFLFV